MEKEDLQKRINELEPETIQPDFWSSKQSAQDVLRELKELKEKLAKQQVSPAPPKDIFLIITRDASIFNPFLPAGKLVADIASLVPELHVIYIGGKQQLAKKINENTFIYTARNIPFLNFFTVYQVILSQLVWKRYFLPTIIVSIGDEIGLAKIFSRKYLRPLYVFYSYTQVLGKSRMSLNALIRTCPKKIIIPNEYIEHAIKSHFLYKSTETQIKILAEYIDMPGLEHAFIGDKITEEVDSRNKIFTMILFPHRANVDCFSTIKKISKEVSSSIKKFQFHMVVKRGQLWQVKILEFFFNLPITVFKESEDSINLFHTSRLMLYFDSPKVPYEPILYSLISGCPVLSSGDEYSKIILFNSGFEEFSHLERNGKTFGLAIKKLINDPYLYSKYKVNCIGFTKTAFTHDHNEYISKLQDILNTHT